MDPSKPVCVDEASFDAQRLMRDYPPKFANGHKQAIFEAVVAWKPAPMLLCASRDRTPAGFVLTDLTELHLSTKAVRKWLPSSTEAAKTGKDRSPWDAGRKLAELVEHCRPGFNARSFVVDSDFTAEIDA